MENLAGYALEANIGGVSMLRGADGKSAYAYAVEGGYTGTEEEFAAKLAAGSGLTTAQINALDGMFKVCAFTKDNVSAEYTAFKTAFGIADSGGGGGDPDVPVTPDVTLTSISVTYSGGDVAVGTAVTDLTGIVVTAHYSDGSTAEVTGYTLDGTIAEGENTVTVIYGGKMTEFVVIGVAESGGEVIMLKNISFDGTSYLDTEVIPVDVNYGYVIGLKYPEAYPATESNQLVGYWAGVSMRDNSSITESNYMDMVFATQAGTNNYKADKPGMNIQLVFAGLNYYLSPGNDKGDGLSTQMYDVPTYAYFSNANRSLWLDENLTVAPTTGHFQQISDATVMSEGQYYDANKMPIQSIWLGRPRVTSQLMQNQYRKIYAGVKFYCFKVYDSNDSLIADMRPAKQGNTIGMWDNVRNKFYPATGTANYEEVPA